MGESSSNSKDLVETPEPWEREFLEAFISSAAYGTVAKAAEAAGINTTMVNNRMKASPGFKMQVDAAKELIRGMTRYEIIRRALEPNEKPVFHRGEIVGHIKEWDNKHLQWVAERMLPEEFHLPTRIEFAGDHDGAINFRLDLGKVVPEIEAAPDESEE